MRFNTIPPAYKIARARRRFITAQKKDNYEIQNGLKISILYSEQGFGLRLVAGLIYFKHLDLKN